MELAVFLFLSKPHCTVQCKVSIDNKGGEIDNKGENTGS